MALIVAPTRELAMQISSVLETITKTIAGSRNCRISVVSIVGGLSEQKQRRQLMEVHKRPIHVIVATPGRLCELMQDDEITVFQDMSRIRYLVVDEVDRIMEEGHFSELSRIFSRIRDHENIVSSGKTPEEVARQLRIGTLYEDDDDRRHKLQQQRRQGEDDDADDLMADDEIDLGPPPPDMEAVQKAYVEGMLEGELGDEAEDGDDEDSAYPDPLSKIKYDGEEDDDDDEQDEDEDFDLEPLESSAPYVPCRQTLLYSATATHRLTLTEEKKLKKNKHKLKDIGEGAVRKLPFHIQELLALVAIKKNTQVVNVSKVGGDVDGDASVEAGLDDESFATLPKTLTQYELRIPVEEKDVLIYYYLIKVSDWLAGKHRFTNITIPLSRILLLLRYLIECRQDSCVC